MGASNVCVAFAKYKAQVRIVIKAAAMARGEETTADLIDQLEILDNCEMALKITYKTEKGE